MPVMEKDDYRVDVTVIDGGGGISQGGGYTLESSHQQPFVQRHSGSGKKADLGFIPPAFWEHVSPGKVTDLEVLEPDKFFELTLKWSFTGSTGYVGTLGTGTYRIQYATYTEADWSVENSQISISTKSVHPGATQYYTVDGLDSGATYYFHLWIVSEAGFVSEKSNQASGTTLLDDTPPAPITEIWASTYTLKGDIKLSWVAPGASGSEGTLGKPEDLAEFRIQYSSNPSQEWGDHETYDIAIPTHSVEPGSLRSYIIEGLPEETTYYFRIWTRDWETVQNWSGISEQASVWVRIAPAAVTDLEAVAEDDGSVTLSWTTPGDNGMTGDITNGAYRIRWSTEPLIDWDSGYDLEFSTNISPDQTNTKSITGLQGGVTFYFRLWTRDSSDGPNYPGNWSYMSNRATAAVTEVISISISPDNYDFDRVLLAQSTVSLNSIQVHNTGNVNLDYTLFISSITQDGGGPSLWRSTDTAPGYNLFRFYAIFHGTNTLNSFFDDEHDSDILMESFPRKSSDENFTFPGGGEYQQTGSGVSMGEERNLWFRIDMPASVSTRRQQSISVTIEAERK